MHLNFRQGLISFQQTGSQPAFLLESSVTGYVDLNVSPVPLICTMAHGSTDYLFQFDTSITAAFGPLIASVDNYLYIELNLITGALTQGVSQLEPIVSAVEPLNPVSKLMWFDLGASVMKVRSNDNLKWIVQPRLVLGKVRNISQILMNPAGSTVGLNTHSHPGFLMLDSQLRPLRTSLGELLTTDSGVRVKTTVGTSGVLTLPTNGFIPARAAEPIPAMSLVYFSGADTISLASSNPSLTVSKAPVAIVQLPLSQNEVGGITQAGEITSDQWDWTGNIGKPLYCGNNGELSVTRPQGAQVYRVGYIKNVRTILFYIDAESTIQITSAPPALVSASTPLTASVGLNLNGETVTTVSIPGGPASTVLTSAGPEAPAYWAVPATGGSTYTAGNLIDGTALTGLSTIAVKNIQIDDIGSGSIVVGSVAIGHNVPLIGVLNTVIGSEAGIDLAVGSTRNVFLGHSVGQGVIAGGDNILIGFEAGNLQASESLGVLNNKLIINNTNSRPGNAHPFIMGDMGQSWLSVQADLSVVGTFGEDRTELSTTGEILLYGSAGPKAGNVGDVITSAGPGLPVTWAAPATGGGGGAAASEPHIYELTGTEAFGTELSVWPSVQQAFAPAAQLINYDAGMANIYFETPGVYRIRLSCAASCVPGDYGTPTSWPYEMTAFGTRLVGTNMTVIGSDKSVHTRGGDFKLDHDLETVHTRAYWDNSITSLGLLAQTNTWVDEYIVLAYTVDVDFPTNGSNFDVIAFTDVGPRPVGFPPHPNVDFKVVLTVEKISANVPVAP